MRFETARTEQEVFDDLERLCASPGYTVRIPDRFAVAWFEEATKQDEPEIQQLFARLLAGAASGDVDAGALGVTERRVTIDSDSVSAALMTLKPNHEGDVFPTWGSRPDIEIRPTIGSTATGLSLARALRLFDEGG